jgi:hypothetical protein
MNVIHEKKVNAYARLACLVAMTTQDLSADTLKGKNTLFIYKLTNNNQILA